MQESSRELDENLFAIFAVPPDLALYLRLAFPEENQLRENTRGHRDNVVDYGISADLLIKFHSSSLA